MLDRPVYLRETADGLFRPIVYLGHKIGEEVCQEADFRRALSLPLKFLGASIAVQLEADALECAVSADEWERDRVLATA